MSSGLGYPDWQKIQQWLGAPLDQATGAAIGAGAINLGPYNLASWASIVVALKPTGGKVTVTVRQKISGGPASLELDQVFIVNAGTTIFEAVVLFGDVVTIALQGDTVGETVDYAIYPSNTTTNAQVITNATINIQHNEALVAAEQTIDFVDATGFVWGIADDAANTRVKVTPPASPVRQLGRGAGVVVSNTVVETTIASLILPAGALLGNSMARLVIDGLLLQNTGAAQNLPDIRVYVNGVLYLSTGAIAAGGGVNSLAFFHGYRILVELLSNGNFNQFLNLTAQGGHGGSAVLGGSFAAGLGAWSSLARMFFAQGRSAAPNANAANPIQIDVTVINAVASANYQWSSDVSILEAATF